MIDIGLHLLQSNNLFQTLMFLVLMYFGNVSAVLFCFFSEALGKFSMALGVNGLNP